MEIIDILTKYSRQPKPANQAGPGENGGTTSLPPIDQSGMLSLVPNVRASPRHKAKTAKKALIPQPEYFVRQQHKAPRPPDGKPIAFADVSRGDIDSWPLGASTRGKPRDEEQHNNGGRKTKPTGETMVNASKPLLLQQLEAFLRRELELVGLASSTADGAVDNIGPRLARLQVFREGFLRLVNDFKTYKPLLLSIKGEYEAMLELYADRVGHMPQYEATIRTLEQETQQTISEQNLLNKMKIKEWKKQLKATQATLAAYAAANATLTDTKTKLTLEVADATAKVGDLMTMNQALLHSMKRQDEHQKEHDSQMSDLHGSLQAITTKYTRAQEEILELRNSIVMLEDKASGVDINADRSTINHLTRELQDLLAFRAVHEKAAKAAPLDEATFVAKCIAFLHADEGVTHVHDAPTVTTIPAMMQRLIARFGSAGSNASQAVVSTSSSVFLTQTPTEHEPDEAVAAAPIDPGEYLEGLGMGDGVPEYLQYTGRVRNKYYSKRDVERMISYGPTSHDGLTIYLARDIWQQKATAEKLTLRSATSSSNSSSTTSGSSRRGSTRSSVSTNSRKSTTNATPPPPTAGPPPCIPLRQYFHTYLTKKYPVRTDAAECAYNVCAALDLFQYDSECRIFQLILQGEIPEDARADQLRVVYSVYEAYAALDKNDPDMSKRKGCVSVGAALRELRILFPWKSDECMSALCRALLLESKGQPHINYTTLLEQDRDGNQTTFCECVRSQHLDELTHLKHLLTTALTGEEKRAGAESNGMISLDAVRRAVRKCDPNRTPAAINALLADCTNLPLERLETESTTLVNAAAVRAKLSTLLIKPSGKVPAIVVDS
ncbi:Aste57867_12876 [Aphanomyces stellatus]|uniref:Aste57867_12876 protein n=1 Tax=Aphanomyces stellatus TaxID=120398 RepID=A0A485KYQ9_9STRA|nr:hypothetical protein As57867_012828 [Aphanomyces stellatus]VFT89723.1 Aste57867_12876 [Aphanomyces stellatus]